MSLKNVFAVLALLAVACGGTRDEGSSRPGSAPQELSLPGLTPIPCAWEGNAIEILVADAWTGCSANSDDPADEFSKDFFGNDPYLTHIRNLMGPAGATLNDPFGSWYTLRATAALNCDPISNEPVTNGVQIELTPVQERILTPLGGDPVRYSLANGELREAGINLCIAQRLRAASPGSSAGESLLLSDANQRLLLETVRERAQIAMLQYALLGVVFSTNPQTLSAPLIDQRIPILQEWAASHGGTCATCSLMLMGRDFAAAVQLHSMVSEELFQLFARSRSARAERGGVSATRADETWGSGSWHQRLLAAAYGGDPLAIVDNSTPWSSWNVADTSLSGDAGAGFLLGPLRYDWPTPLQRPYSTVSVLEPQVHELLGLARRFDAIDLLANPSSTECSPFDVEASGNALYKSIEAEVRVADCYKTSTLDPCPTVPTPPTYEYGAGTYLLWEKYHITPEHSHALAAMLADSLGGRNSATFCTTGVDLDDVQFGARDFAGTAVTDAGGGLTHFSDDTAFSNVAPAEVAGAFTRNASLRFPLPWDLDPAVGGLWDVVMTQLAFDDNCFASGCNNHKNADAKRLMGALSAEAATREMVAGSVAWLAAGFGPVDVLFSYFLQTDDILNLIEAGVGPITSSLRPNVVRTIASGSNLPTTAVQTSGTGYVHSVQVLVPPADPWWDNCGAQGCTALTGLLAVTGPWARALAAQPNSSIYGQTLFSLAVTQTAPFTFGTSFLLPAPFFINSMPKVWLATPLVLPAVSAPPGPPNPDNPFDPSGVYTLVAVRFDSAAPPDDAFSFRLIAANVAIPVASPRDAQYIATAGALGNWVSSQSEVRSSNPSEPAIDGFGLPTAWVPPLAAQLIGGTPGQPSSEVYLKLAKDSASEAASAVQSALQDLTQQQQDDATKAAAAAKAAGGIKEDRDALCGADNQACDTSFSPGVLANPSGLVDCDPSGLSDTDPAKGPCEFDHFTFTEISTVTSTVFSLATPVAESITEPIVPAFSAYSGGSLQAGFITQWSAFQAIGDKLDELRDAVSAAKATLNAAQVALQVANEQQTAQCSRQTMHDAMLAGKAVHGGASPSVTGTCTPDFCVPSYGFSLDGDKDWSVAPLIAQRQACILAMTGVPAAEAEAIASQATAFVQVANAAVDLHSTVGGLRLSTASIAKLIGDAKLVDERYKLEQTLAQFGLQTSFSAYRISRGYDLWRARALVESSRRYAVAARRAVEARYVVDLSRLDKNEVFVSSPKIWADEIYGYDLTLPAAVGLTLSTDGAGDTIYPNKIGDYVANLEAFVNGYAASRPTAVATNEIDVVTLPGLKPDPIQIPIDPNDPNSPTVVANPDSVQWLVHCPSQSGVSGWVPAVVGCDGQPDRAKLLFALDPWGRLNGAVSNPPFEKRFNARFDLLAANFVGTGVRDCQNAADPPTCYSEPFIKYNLTQVGFPWVTDFDQFWRILLVPTGHIEGAKAIAAEIWLDPLKDGWSTSYISAVARSEWQNRPLGGAYELEFQVTPDIKLDRIERVQLLVGSSSWVKQE